MAGVLFISDYTNPFGNTIKMPDYTGPLPGISSQYITVTTDSLGLATASPNVFIHSGSGNDAIRVSSGRNVLDGGTGSNFLVGGSGTDTFFVDGRGAGVTWSSLVNFHSGDDATIWGWVQGVSKLTWADNQGAQGYLGATMHIDLRGTGSIDDSMTFTGYTVARAQQFVQQAGSVQGNNYLHITFA